MQCLSFLKSDMRCGDPVSVLGETIAFSSKSLQWEIPSKFAWSFPWLYVLETPPHIFEHQTLPPLPLLGKSWVCRHCWLRRNHLSGGDHYLLKAFTSSVFWPAVPSWLLWAFLTGLQCPSPLWMVTASYRHYRKCYSVLAGPATMFPFFHCVLAMMREQRMGFAFWNISSFCFQAGRNEISPSTSALFFILFFSALSLSGSVAHLVMSLQTLGLGIISPDFGYLKLRHKV